MDSRITIAKDKHGSINVYMNEAGRARLVRALQMLSETDDHFHIGPAHDESSEFPVQTVAYREDEDVVLYGKVLFRPDAWDARHYPHVMQGSRGPSESQ